MQKIFNIQTPEDEWTIALDKKLINLKQCQNIHNLNSCTPCQKIIDCKTRQEYVKAVYKSMSKGAGGGFEF
jgi:hypothetical protein